ncbi:MAG: carbohydrate ABC transporter substrate-binding protein [Lachnospiraceae bacterium]|nr:carbohydrate ABC transporter substrate-binding protein [Lachnospiraceae bacterium]
MKKRLLALSMAMIMVAGTMAGCTSETGTGTTTTTTTDDGGSGTTTTEAAPTKAPELDTTVEAEDISAEEEGKVLNIYCWNEEFKSRVTDHYPGYTEVDATHGKIGDIDVVWNITANQDNAYQNNLDETLLKQESAAADDKIDLFLVEADYALKYVDTDYTLPVTDLGISLSELGTQYKYTQDVMTSSDGKLKGVSWQGCPGVLIYSRAAAKEVLGSDDPATVQEAVKDWDTYKATAADMKKAGYFMTATTNDTFRTFSNNVSTPWVSADKKIQIDDNIKKWVDDTKELFDAGYIKSSADLWSADWNSGFQRDGKVFCYFGPAWMINFSMGNAPGSVDEDGNPKPDDGTITFEGGWGATEGPQGFFWGGTWICAANGTDNKATVADIMRKLTVDKDIMMDIVKADSDFVNNQPAMEEAATNDDYAFAVLGGQNPLAMFANGAKAISLDKITGYDQGCNEEFQKAMKDYFDGNADYDTALNNFYDAITAKYPALSK